jgi:hypothetical protein
MHRTTVKMTGHLLNVEATILHLTSSYSLIRAFYKVRNFIQ